MVKVAPSQLLPGSAFALAAFQGGLEVRLSDHMSLLAEGGLPFQYPHSADIADSAHRFSRYRGLRLSLEPRYYIHTYGKTGRSKDYIALHGQLENTTATRLQQDYEFREGGYYSRPTQYTVDRRVLVGRVLFGYQWFFARHFLLDVSLGPGLRHVESTSHGRLLPVLDEDGYFSKPFDGGSRTYPDFYLFLRFGIG